MDELLKLTTQISVEISTTHNRPYMYLEFHKKIVAIIWIHPHLIVIQYCSADNAIMRARPHAEPVNVKITLSFSFLISADLAPYASN